MGIKNTDERNVIKTINLDNLVPENRIIRKIDKTIDLSFIYDKVNIGYRWYLGYGFDKQIPRLC